MTRKMVQEGLWQSGEGRSTIPYRLHRRKGVRRLILRVEPDGRLALTVPWHFPATDIWDFVRSKEDWIADQRARQETRPDLWTVLQGRPWLSFYGGEWPIVWLPEGTPVGLRGTPSRQGITLGGGLPGEPSSARSRLLRLTLEGLARRHLPPHAAALGHPHGLLPRRLTVRDQKSRWGSCSGSGALSLNWRLCLLPPELHDYVLWHELAHLRHLNHSPDYWAYLNSLCPRAGYLDQRLTAEGGEVLSW